jgi:hypothetical protein
VTSSGPGELQALTSFMVSAEYRRRETTFDIRRQGKREPVARLHKNSAILSLEPFQLVTGPQLTEPAGRVTRAGAWAPDGTRIGGVEHVETEMTKKLDPVLAGSAGRVSAWNWRVNQDGLPTLTGRPAGISTRLRFNALTDQLLGSSVLSGHNPVDYVLPFKFQFDAPGVAGFLVSRRAGRPRIDVVVRDARIDRRLVLACVVSIHSFHTPTLRQSAVTYTTIPGKG